MPVRGAFAHNASTLMKLRTIGQFDIKPDSNQEWFQLRSTILTSKQLFLMLQAVWPAIVGAEPHKFALIHCLGGASAGVWVHLLPSDDYEHGCFEVASF